MSYSTNISQSMNTPTPEPIPEKITLEFDPSKLPQQSQKDLEANATLQRCTRAELLARLIQKKLGNIFTVRAA